MPEKITLPSRLDIKTAAPLWSQLSTASGPLCMDASDLRHIGAAGLQVLLVAQKHQAEHGSQIRITSATPEIAQLLEQSGLVSLLTASEAEGRA